MPRDTFQGGYDARLTETYRWGCVEARIRNIFSATVGNSLLQSAEFLVDENMPRKRKEVYQARHEKKRKIRNAQSLRRPRKTQLSPAGKRKTRDLPRINNNIKARERVRFEGSKHAVESILNRMFHAITQDRAVSKTDNCSSERREKMIVEEKEVLHEFPQKLFQLTKKEHVCGVQHCRPSATKRKKHYLILSLRFFRYIATWKCKAVIIGKLLDDRKTWNMSYKLDHTHDCPEVTDTEEKKRVETVCSSSLSEVRREDKSDISSVFTLQSSTVGKTERGVSHEDCIGGDAKEVHDIGTGSEDTRGCDIKAFSSEGKEIALLASSTSPNCNGSGQKSDGTVDGIGSTWDTARVVILDETDVLPSLDPSWDNEEESVMVGHEHCEELTTEYKERKVESLSGTSNDVEVEEGSNNRMSHTCDYGELEEVSNDRSEFFEHTEMLAVLMSFIDSRPYNAPEKEVLFQL